MIVEHNEKRRAEKGIPPTSIEWVNSQPERWQLICMAFAMNINTTGGIVNKTVDQIVKNANAAGARISKRTVSRYLPDLERYGVVRQERNFARNDDGEIRREPSMWMIALRASMPDYVLPPHDPLDLDASNAAWLQAHGIDVTIAEMNARVAGQSPEPPF